MPTCGSCHTLADAGTTGRIGPNLDDESPDDEDVLEQMLKGEPPMPSFRGKLSRGELDKLASYVSRVAVDD